MAAKIDIADKTRTKALTTLEGITAKERTIPTIAIVNKNEATGIEAINKRNIGSLLR